jgi:hypothetical protein
LKIVLQVAAKSSQSEKAKASAAQKAAAAAARTAAAAKEALGDKAVQQEVLEGGGEVLEVVPNMATPPPGSPRVTTRPSRRDSSTRLPRGSSGTTHALAARDFELKETATGFSPAKGLGSLLASPPGLRGGSSSEERQRGAHLPTNRRGSVSGVEAPETPATTRGTGGVATRAGGGGGGGGGGRASSRRAGGQQVEDAAPSGQAEHPWDDGETPSGLMHRKRSAAQRSRPTGPPPVPLWGEAMGLGAATPSMAPRGMGGGMGLLDEEGFEGRDGELLCGDGLVELHASPLKASALSPPTPRSPVTRSMAALLGGHCMGAAVGLGGCELKAGTYLMGQHFGTTRLDRLRRTPPRKEALLRSPQQQQLPYGGGSAHSPLSRSPHEAEDETRHLLSPNYSLRNRRGTWDVNDTFGLPPHDSHMTPLRGSKVSFHGAASPMKMESPSAGGGGHRRPRVSDPPAPGTKEPLLRTRRRVRGRGSEDGGSGEEAAYHHHHSPPHSPTHSGLLGDDSMMLMASMQSGLDLFASPQCLLTTPSSRRRLQPLASPRAGGGCGGARSLAQVDLLAMATAMLPVGGVLPSPRQSKRRQSSMDELPSLSPPLSPEPAKRPRLRRALGYQSGDHGAVAVDSTF